MNASNDGREEAGSNEEALEVDDEIHRRSEEVEGTGESAR
jgi:hypothetical protein